MFKFFKIPSYIAICLFITSCATAIDPLNIKLPAVPLKAENQDSKQVNVVPTQQNQTAFKELKSNVFTKSFGSDGKGLAERFSNENSITVSIDSLKIQNFVHYVFGETLKISYILDSTLENDERTITLNLQDKISKQKLFSLAESLLVEKGYGLAFSDGIYAIKPFEGGGQSTAVFAFGNTVSDIPETTLDIMMVVPFEYGMQSSIGLLLRKFANVEMLQSERQSSFMLRGKRPELIKAFQFLSFVDKPDMRNRLISMYAPVFMRVDEVVRNLDTLMSQEGYSVSFDKRADGALSIVKVDKIGAFFMFAQNQQILDRANFWLTEIDKPIKGDQKQYFYFKPENSSAEDLGQSLQNLFGGSSSNRTSAASENEQMSSRSSSMSGNPNIEMMIDNRTSSLIFYATGEEYQKVLPLIKRMDVLPKQVMLEMIIAEVSLTDEFKQGVEFALSQGNYGVTTQGAFMGAGFGGLSYVLTGPEGQVNFNLLNNDSLVNIVSRPRVVVRDGIQASIIVGTDIPVVGSTTSDPIQSTRQTTNIEYRTTGVNVSVTPFVNSDNNVLMKINQSISNTVDSGSTTSVNPSVFQRSISTEVIAGSGQTVVLGGLISENKSKKNSKVPLLGDIPGVGKLFRSDTENGDKTELIVMIRPQIIGELDDWNAIKQEFTDKLTNINLLDE